MITPVLGKLHVEAVSALAESIWHEHYTAIIGEAQVRYMIDKYQSVNAVEAQIKEEGYLYFLITDRDEYVGYVGMQPREENLFLSKVYVHADARGRGLARRALHYAEQIARAKGLSSITLTVNRNNRIAIDVYKTMGFAIVGEQVADIGGGYVMDDYVMRLLL